jgi:hypothetical protein
MFLNSFSATEADAHRQALIADAENWRLARLARRRRRRPDPPPDVRPERKVHEERRYAVSP